MEQLNYILKYNIRGNKRKEGKIKSNHDIIKVKEKENGENYNDKYLNKSKLIGKKYIDKVINECNDIYINSSTFPQLRIVNLPNLISRKSLDYLVKHFR